MLARIGALNSLGEVEHRRDALWQVEYAGRPPGRCSIRWEKNAVSPSADDIEERLVADFAGTGVTVGKHPMAFHREKLTQMRFRAAAISPRCRNKQPVVAGCVIARQRPGTAKGFVFLSLEDETGIANAIITPAVYEQFKTVVLREISADRRPATKPGERHLGEGPDPSALRDQPRRCPFTRFSLTKIFQSRKYSILVEFRGSPESGLAQLHGGGKS